MKVLTWALAFGLGLLMQWILRDSGREQSVDKDVSTVIIAHREKSNVALSGMIELVREHRGLETAARLLERMDRARSATFPHLYALFSIQEGEWLELLERKWMEKDPEGMLRFYLRNKHVRYFGKLADQVFEVKALDDPDFVLSLTAEMASDRERCEAQWLLLAVMAKTDPVAGADWLAQNFEAFDRDSFLSPSADGSVRENYTGPIVDLALKLENSEMKRNLIRRLFGNWSVGSKAAAAWCRIDDDALAVEVFDTAVVNAARGNPQTNQRVLERIEELVETHPNSEMVGWVMRWGYSVEDADTLRQIFDFAFREKQRETISSYSWSSLMIGMMDNLSAERHKVALEYLDRLPRGDWYDQAASDIAKGFANQGDFAGGMRWSRTLDAITRDSVSRDLGEVFYRNMDGNEAISHAKENLKPDELPAIAEGLGRSSFCHPQELLSYADQLDGLARERFLKGAGSRLIYDAGATLDVMPSWGIAERKIVLRGMLDETVDAMETGGISPPELTVAQKARAKALAESLIVNPENRRWFLRCVGAAK